MSASSTDCALLDKVGAVSRRLFAIGPVTVETFRKMVTVPDLRRQAETLADMLARQVKAVTSKAA